MSEQKRNLEDELLAGDEEAQKIGQEEDQPLDSAMIQALQTKAMIDVAQAVKTLVEGQERVRQIPYNEMKPVTPWNPEGKRDRVKLTREWMQHGYPVNPLFMTEETIKLFNQVKPGRYWGRKIEVQRLSDGSMNLTWSNAKIEQRMEVAMRFPHIDDILKMCIEERAQKEARLKLGQVDENDYL